MKIVANPYKLSKEAKDYLVALGQEQELEEKITYRIFIFKNIRYLHDALAYFRENNISARQGEWDMELDHAYKKPWNRRRLSRHIPASHFPIHEKKVYWFNAKLSSSELAKLSMESWVQEIRVVYVPREIAGTIAITSAFSSVFN